MYFLPFFVIVSFLMFKSFQDFIDLLVLSRGNFGKTDKLLTGSALARLEKFETMRKQKEEKKNRKVKDFTHGYDIIPTIRFMYN